MVRSLVGVVGPVVQGDRVEAEQSSGEMRLHGEKGTMFEVLSLLTGCLIQDPESFLQRRNYSGCMTGSTYTMVIQLSEILGKEFNLAVSSVSSPVRRGYSIEMVCSAWNSAWSIRRAQ